LDLKISLGNNEKVFGDIEKIKEFALNHKTYILNPENTEVFID